MIKLLSKIKSSDESSQGNKDSFFKRAGWPIGFGPFRIVNSQPSANNSISLIRADAQHEQKKSRDGSCDGTTDIQHSQKLCFWKNHKEVFNWLNSVS